MKLSRPRRQQRDSAQSRHAFTLIELLVVITIIAVLAGLLLPVISKVTENARKVDAKTAETHIVTAIKSYQSDYGTYPVATAATPTDKTYNSTGGNTNNTLFNILRALNTDYAATGLNTRRVIYFEGNDAKSATTPKNGFVPVTAAGATGNKGVAVNPGDFLDPWGNEYCIRMDSNYTDAVLSPYSSGEGDGAATSDTGSEGNVTSVLRFGVIVWSDGADGKINTSPTSGDDVVSWQ